MSLLISAGEIIDSGREGVYQVCIVLKVGSLYLSKSTNLEVSLSLTMIFMFTSIEKMLGNSEGFELMYQVTLFHGGRFCTIIHLSFDVIYHIRGQWL